VDQGDDVNEVEGAGNTPLHNAVFDGWLEGCELLMGLGAKVGFGGLWWAASRAVCQCHLQFVLA